MNYQIIPRKYRPKRFAEVVGHEAILTTLKNALQLNQVSQSYIFCGSRGTGKTTLARLFAKALNCSHLSPEGEPCNECPSCQDCLDILEIDGASHRGIDDMRLLSEQVGYAATGGKFKIYIIDEVHMLTKEAFNALLKTLEEPPSHVKFFFATTEPHKVPLTILSRCQRFDLKRLPLSAIKNKLTRICQELSLSIEDQALEKLIQRADGSLRDAESLLDQVSCATSTRPISLNAVETAFGLLPSIFFHKLDEAIQSGEEKNALPLSEELFNSGKDMAATLDGLMEHFRLHLFNSKPYTKGQCLAFLDTLLEWEETTTKISIKKRHFEMLLISLIRIAKRPSLDQIIDRLFDLEKKLSDPTEEKKPVAPSVEVKKNPPMAHPSKYDTLMRFAAVELEGSIKK